MYLFICFRFLNYRVNSCSVIFNYYKKKYIMRTIKYFCYLIGLFFYPSYLQAQEKNIKLNTVYTNYILGSNFLLQNSNNQLSNSNSVNLKQIGEGNYSDIYIKSSNSKVEVDQYGNNNYIDVYKKSSAVVQNVFQSGSNNFVSDYSSNSYIESNMTINQNGNNLKVYNNGSNSISKNLIINQKGNSGTIYIFNH